ncbi:hypothetical protein EZS27_040181, partial [termite gut metagenome]
TSGIYSTLNGQYERHRYILNWDLYRNQSYAEMTMYPNDPDEKPMFMLTWPDIRTLNSGFSISDEFYMNERNTLRLLSKIALQRSGVESDFGLSTLQIYYPEMQKSAKRLVWNLTGRYQFKAGKWEFSAGGGYATRTPSPSEAYGYFLYNTFDGYDYLGNPGLKNESSAEANLAIGWKNNTLHVNAETTYFFFNDYIIGKPDENLHRMTIGAAGVKVYRNLPHASLLNTDLLLRYRFLDYYVWKNRFTYSLGRDNNKAPLPLVPPLSGASSVS